MIAKIQAFPAFPELIYDIFKAKVKTIYHTYIKPKKREEKR